ncbi:hypothetical protein D3C73_1018460 [compost metagenome]
MIGVKLGNQRLNQHGQCRCRQGRFPKCIKHGLRRAVQLQHPTGLAGAQQFGGQIEFAVLLRDAFGARAVLDMRRQQQRLAANQPATAARPFFVLPGAIQRAGTRPQQHGAVVLMPMKGVARLAAGGQGEACLGNQILFGRKRDGTLHEGLAGRNERQADPGGGKNGRWASILAARL